MEFVEPILEKKLRCIALDERTGRITWEHKTWNIHRGVIHWRTSLEKLNPDQVFAVVRDHIFETYKMRWWRGFAFGVILEAHVIPEDSRDLATLLDMAPNPEGVWQWLICVCHPLKAAVGFHTWSAGYLTPTYTELLEAFRKHDFRIGNVQAQPPVAPQASDARATGS